MSEKGAADVFAFEGDFRADLRCIPMAVRRKLDECGIKLSLKDWVSLSNQEREGLLARPAATPAERGGYARDLDALVVGHKGTPPARLDVPAAFPWDDGTQVPIDVQDKARGHGVAIDPGAWTALSPLQRFALIKLVRPQHKNENFLPACREFGLVRG